MNDRREQLKKRIIAAVVVFIVLFSVLGLIFGRKNTAFEQMIKETFQTIEYYVVKAPINFVNDIKNEYFEIRNAFKENEELRAVLDDYALIVAQNEALKKELNDITEIANIENVPVNFKKLNATVISRDIESWNSKFMINVGMQNGIEEGMVVLSNDGMIGKINSVSEFTATVSLLTAENGNTQTPVMISVNGSETDYAYGMLLNYDVSSGNFIVNMVEEVELSVGSKVFTSGLGGISPRGVLIGYVESYSTPDNQLLLRVEIKPSSNFNDINYVTVLQRSDSNE